MWVLILGVDVVMYPGGPGTIGREREAVVRERIAGVWRWGIARIKWIRRRGVRRDILIEGGDGVSGLIISDGGSGGVLEMWCLVGGWG